MQYEKLNETSLKVIKPVEVKEEVIEYDYDFLKVKETQLIEKEAQIVKQQADLLAKNEAELAETRKLIAECERLGVKSQDAIKIEKEKEAIKDFKLEPPMTEDKIKQ